ncbi:hypothetical protein M407DRAFT_240629 [Tulasnella calospora MUT 4182]|uniref:ThuA-like domain-containing protein n=1 Tax=Tulasnella calospora MUT 4182 TaxID=1051891 RepID=A0A0C3QMQ7_9AGAM|nr:hypothetical protein M407DRAFT_240629 [Tulasnella calospora MUT 4182]
MVAAQPAKVLIFSATNGYRHESIPDAISALTTAGPSHNIEFDQTEDSTAFTDANLTTYDAILFLMVTDVSPNDIINLEQQTAFQNYLNSGGNFVGIHSASDCLHDAVFYQREIGAYFWDHPTLGEATFLNNVDPTHPTVSMIPERWTYTEEVYHFKQDPRSVGAKVVLTVDPNSAGANASAAIQGDPHPIAWYQERGAGASEGAPTVGRSFYTSLGHLSSTWADETFMAHIMAGITWSLGSNTTKAFNPSTTVGNAALKGSATTGWATSLSCLCLLPAYRNAPEGQPMQTQQKEERGWGLRQLL